MKILFIGNLNKYTRSYQRFRAMVEMGYEVKGLSFEPIGTVAGITEDTRTLYQKVMNKLGHPLDITDVNGKMINEYNRIHYDLAWIEKGLMVKPKILNQIKEKVKTKLLFYSNDNMSKKHYQSRYFLQSICIYDYIVIIKEYNADFFTIRGCKNVISVDRSYDKYYIKNRPDNTPYIYDVVFIGTYEKHRYKMLLELANEGITVTVFGNNWPMYSNPFLNIMHRPIYGDEFIYVMHTSKIILNFLRKCNDDKTTGRTFEIPASGSFMLSERTKEQLKYFEEGKESEFFGSKEELLEKSIYYLNHDEKRESIAREGRKRCVYSGYSHHDRLEYILSEINRTRN
ncbi:MAG: glycosyltransferase family 1 protein [Candidatus Marinimicrobia bacterium]|nr:glycosyltransferase family 1 protein [Candidatus Neomarinimicrobiota bacterium]